jgi:hypothetical protein
MNVLGCQLNEIVVPMSRIRRKHLELNVLVQRGRVHGLVRRDSMRRMKKKTNDATMGTMWMQRRRMKKSRKQNDCYYSGYSRNE